MARGIAILAKALGIIALALVVAVFVWDYIAVHPRGPLLDYRVEAANASAGAVVSVGGPDSETIFNGSEGYAWEIKPISITESQAVIDFRVKHFNYFAPSTDMRAQLQQAKFRRFTLHPRQPLIVAAPDGAKLSLSGLIY